MSIFLQAELYFSLWAGFPGAFLHVLDTELTALVLLHGNVTHGLEQKSSAPETVFVLLHH